MKEIINQKSCPFCGKNNNCKANTEEDCWCNYIKVPLELRELIAPEQRMKACICKECIELFKENTPQFITQYIKV